MMRACDQLGRRPSDGRHPNYRAEDFPLPTLSPQPDAKPKARALAAVRRGRPWGTWTTDLSAGLIVDFLREEGRLAAATGDTAGAVQAYEHYLALRDDPEPPWRAQRDSVQAELATLRSRR